MKHMEYEVLNLRTRRRIAKLWGVPPFRVDVQVDPERKLLKATIDGHDPDETLQAILEKDIRDFTQAAVRGMN